MRWSRSRKGGSAAARWVIVSVAFHSAGSGRQSQPSAPRASSSPARRAAALPRVWSITMRWVGAGSDMVQAIIHESVLIGLIIGHPARTAFGLEDSVLPGALCWAHKFTRYEDNLQRLSR